MLISQIEHVEIIPSVSEIEAILLEANLIKKFDPKYNVRLTDGKNYLLLKVSVKDEMPKLLLTRRQEDKRSKYFGPFPSSSNLRLVLKIIRRIFPFQTASHQGRRICLYRHMGLCPCPATLDTSEKKSMYRRDIARIIKFLNGKTADVVSDLEKERNTYSRAEQFEKASEIQKKIDAIKAITSPFYKPFEFETNPLLKTKVVSDSIISLRIFLKNNGVEVSSLSRIECFDISNTSGTNATGSMVVFVNGEKITSFYRRFRIKNIPKKIPNDFEMIREIIRRRLNHLDDWGRPDLIIIDGGKGQVSSAKSVLSENNAGISMIGLAKREEKIITEDFKILTLPRNSGELLLIRRIRDEAHRFAISYHKKLRAKAIFA